MLQVRDGRVGGHLAGGAYRFLEETHPTRPHLPRSNGGKPRCVLERNFERTEGDTREGTALINQQHAREASR